MQSPLRLPRKTRSEHPTVVQACGVFNLLIWRCASRHNGAHFFNISTSKCVPMLRCFVRFDLELCFAPQRGAAFHLSFDQMAPHPPALASLLFDPPEPQITGQTQWGATFLPFRAHLLSSDFFSSLIFFLFLLFSDASHLCFPSVHIVGSLTSINFLRSVLCDV